MIGYHYTTIESFMSIVETGKLRLTNTLNQNDYTEAVYIDSIVHSLMGKYKNQYPSGFWEEFISSHRLEGNVYTTSFSKDDDSLSQWRAYAGDGSGVAIGLNLDSFANKIETDSHNFFDLWDELTYSNVEYDEEVQRQYVEDVLKWGVDELKNGNWYLPALSNTLWHKLDAMGIKVKHPKFFEEHEVRLIKLANRIQNESGGFFYETESQKVIWKNGKYGLSRCIEISIDLSASIHEIVIGPKLFGNIESIRYFLMDHNIHGKNLKRSKCPYR